jgi:hypothetical protein
MGPSEVEDTWRELRISHLDQELLDSNLARREVDGNIVMHPALAIPDATVVALIDSRSQLPFDLLTEQGCIKGNLWPDLALLSDINTQAAFNHAGRRLFLTGNLRDAILLRSLGLAAAPVRGFTELDQTDLLQLEDRCQIRVIRQGPELHGEPEEGAATENEEAPGAPGGSQDSSSQQFPPVVNSPPEFFPTLAGGICDENSIRLILVSWSPTAAIPVALEAVRETIDYLSQLSEFGLVDTTDVEIWVPTKSWRAIEFSLGRKHPGWLKETMLHSAQFDVRRLGRADANALKRPDDLATAIAALHETLQGDSHRESSRTRRQEALRVCEKMITKQILQPLLEETQNLIDPVDRAVLFQFAQLSNLFSRRMLGMREDLFRDERTAIDPADNKSIADLISLSSQLVTLSKELARCRRQSKKSAPAKNQLRYEGIARFGASDLMNTN